MTYTGKNVWSVIKADDVVRRVINALNFYLFALADFRANAVEKVCVYKGPNHVLTL